mgnify:CR=1 FL=1
MQRETSNDSFLDYGSVYHQPIDREHPELCLLYTSPSPRD